MISVSAVYVLGFFPLPTKGFRFAPALLDQPGSVSLVSVPHWSRRDCSLSFLSPCVPGESLLPL